MKSIAYRHLLIGLSMLAAAALALGLTPRPSASGAASQVNLETMIPTQFGDWRLDETVVPIAFRPDVQAEMDRIYTQMLDRTYVNSQGAQIMLMIAYGSKQNYSMQVHRPEVCYPSLGFRIGDISKDVIHTEGRPLPVMKMVATRGPRIEPVTYWVMIGDSPVRGNLEQHLARVKFGLSGEVPSGMLIRVSTLSADASKSYQVEENFVRAMLGAVPAPYRELLSGAG
jgi:EpsI family protein